MRAAEADLLFIPGLGGSGPNHWQRRWAEKLSTGRAVDLPGLDKPKQADWQEAINSAVAACERPVVLIAHSLGVLAAIQSAHAMQAKGSGTGAKIRAAFLVAPPASRVIATIGEIDPEFTDVPSDPLPFPSLLVASQTDPYATMPESEGMALDWGAQLVDAGEAGHLNVESGHGPWPEGLMRFAAFLARI